ncbi:MAG TPA: TM2 domain-containing protein [Candidatus Scatovivens faecipullorum]|nr:TM2 domain-containing protein [Candidatus Scatovivens faecipullorum]
MEENLNNVSKKNRFTTLMLCWFLGFFGVHRLYAGRLGSGFLMLYGTICSTLILAINLPIGLMCFITMAAFVVNDFVVIAFKQFSDCYGKCICDDSIY